jgi:N-carbamoyl-L-amino-acid hydrolase
VLFGSHLDSQPTGGKFDGALGVIAGLEVMRSLHDLGITTEAPLELVNWTDEEGSRFGHSLMGSGVWAGVYEEAKAMALRDPDGISVAEALDGIGYRGPEPARPFPADSYFELHIEQGPILEAEGKTVGIVSGAQAQVWFDAVITGQDAHAGTTPPSARRDALVAAARVIARVDALMRERGEDGRGNRRLPPGPAQFLQRRPRRGPLLHRVPPPPHRRDRGPRRLFPRRSPGPGGRDRLHPGADGKVPLRPPALDAGCVALVRDAAARLGLPAREIISGAGHDAVYVARHVPTAMIFTPCKDGLSHNEAESILPAEAEAGCQVLFEAVVARANRPL